MFTLKYTILVDKAKGANDTGPTEREEHTAVAGPWAGREYPEQMMCEMVQRFPAALVSVTVEGEAAV